MGMERRSLEGEGGFGEGELTGWWRQELRMSDGESVRVR